MNKRESLQAFAEVVPPRIRKKLNLGDLQELAGGLLVKDKIHSHFQAVWQSEERLRVWKARNGYCEGAAGRVQCMNKIGEDKSARTRKLCATCRRIQDGYTARGPGIRSVKRSEYGEIRIRERKAGEK